MRQKRSGRYRGLPDRATPSGTTGPRDGVRLTLEADPSKGDCPMKNPTLLLSVLLVSALASCGRGHDAPASSTTAMAVEPGVHLEFRVAESYGPTPDDEECQALHPDTGGEGPVHSGSAQEPVTVCAEIDGFLFKVDFGPSVVTEVDVEYIDYDYGTAAIPTVYVVLDDTGIAAWNEAMAGTFSHLHVLVDGRAVAIADSSLSPNDIVQIGGIGTIEEAETIATTMASGFD
jgi:hypothetical protein